MRQRILDHAEAQLLKYGYKALRVDDLARAAGISKRTLYEQFLTKHDIAHDALAGRLDRLARAIDRASRRRPRDEPAQLLEIATLIWQADGEARPKFFVELEPTPLAELVDTFRTRSAAAVDRVIRSGIKHGQFRKDLDPGLARRVLLAGLATLAPPERPPPGGSPERPDQAIAAILDVILHGLSAV
ncbi:TetR/AcrR family transcriptional regulator [Enhygromyxa salina]|uniref:HTH-type transcriptional repressor KstR2 n=1 Tax=Enhygromyxa salina TaxID=215803 RepID=A0A2S9YBZ7_9BACT|nr:TetR/AcrR family transcriptional regulator [Enhygromyxa salina]PRQ02648.1 HTH-type transcriptional repressor KstR2 [Enhygromyxa salina]